jgi:hypothetical protein
MIVGPGEAERYLEPVVERVLRWADGLHIALEPDSYEEEKVLGGIDSMGYLRVSADENDGMAKTDAWTDAVNVFRPSDDDLMAFVKPTEVILDPDAVRMAAKEHPNLALKCRLCHMWDEDHIRIDGSWEPKDETVFVPFKRGGSYPDYRLRAGRLPTYHFNFQTHGVPMSYMLDYDMMSFDDKLAKWDWFERVGGSDFFSIDHITSIKRTPTLRTWKKGGVLNVGQTF